jgi:hypothetical protein
MCSAVFQMHHLPEKIRHSMVLYQPTATTSKKNVLFIHNMHLHLISKLQFWKATWVFQFHTLFQWLGMTEL